MSQLPKQPTEVSVPTSADVARLAGVSRATVSYVLNNNAAVRISEPTRHRVREAATQLGYVPHAAARSLRAGHSRLVLLPSGHIPSGPLHQYFFQELQAGLRRLDYTVVQYGSAGLADDEAVRAWAELRPVAVVVPPGITLTPHGTDVLTRSGAKAVITLGPEPVAGAHGLVMDQRRVGASAVAHLLARGRRRIGVVMPREPGLTPFSEPRLAGARQTAEPAGARVCPLPLGYEEESAAELAGRWRELELDAVFAYNDEYAMLLMRALQDAGVAIPGDTAVIGADDLLLGRLLRPRLSTVRMELAMDQPLAETIDRLVHHPGTAPVHQDLLRTGTVHRDSS
ncbi:LacI family DNA-binding transcriptional regulator [Streptomyces bacillaris]|uniref:LacI family transcriptional regulator n=1 Tax=Streptomyces cavourensis TaxID=67258 RepID=A0AAD0QB26_9ACTN|nr:MULTISPECIES: LacI family DNA-binding transcriptional regulator [Streptomyces]MYR40085.1 substrate-binding domain-containing protein [Streptomyces sp. SID4944]NUW18886.1 LacI family transcriptional regulator [Streptomyces roseoviolaceus]ALC26027.1 LacI family transcriptional regulator [Streptomyces sp. CFMR 7]AXI75325.1 LacI family transcriptional regulator [Streptomyces cavourensis]MBH0245842.1 LacI family DNA-binding transcriptional regulator [Streptomyces cavourensis]